MNKKKWNITAMSDLVLLTLLIPVGLIIGSINLKFDERKKQAIILIALGIVSLILWIFHFAGLHH